MQKKLHKLDKRQEAKLGRVIKKWQGIGLASGPADVDALDSAICSLYLHAGYSGLPRIFRMPSPTACLLSMPVIDASLNKRQTDARTERIRKEILVNLREQMTLEDNDCFWQEYFNLPILFSATMGIGSTLSEGSRLLYSRASRGLVHNINVRVRLELQASSMLAQATFDNLGVARHRDLPGCNASSDFAFYEFSNWLFNDSRGAVATEWRRRKAWYDKEHRKIFSRVAKIAENCFCWWAMSDFAVVCDRPVSKRDEQDRLHCENGPAISFDDGFAIYVWHGVIVPEQVILFPESQTVKDIHGESNAEIRRIRIERFSWQRYLQETNARTLDNRKNDAEGTNESLMNSPNGNALVCACPSTGRVYALEVPGEIKTCQQAQLWLSGGLSKRITAAT